RVVGPVTRAGLDERVEDQVRGVPGVAAVAPAVQGVTYAYRGDHGRALVLFVGIDCQVESLLGRLGCSPEAVAQAHDTDPPLVSAKLAHDLGSDAVIRTDVGTVPLAGAPQVQGLDRLNRGRVAVYPLPVAQRLFGRAGRLDAV